MTLKSLLIKTNVILKNIFFYLAWFLFLIAFYLGGINYIPCFIFAFVFFKIYLLIAKGDLDSDVFM